MHRIVYELRTIAASDLPTVIDRGGGPRIATEEELRNLGLVHLSGDVYECVRQERRDPETLAWSTHGPDLPGVVIAAGSQRERYASVPAEHAADVFRAQVIRSDDPETPAAVAVAENLAEVAATLAEYVGDVDGAPLVDVDSTAATLAEAQRLVEIPGNGIERVTVPMAQVDAGDVIEAEDLIPHRWQGESLH